MKVNHKEFQFITSGLAVNLSLVAVEVTRRSFMVCRHFCLLTSAATIQGFYARVATFLFLNLFTVLLLQNASATLWIEDGITNGVGNNLGATAPYSGGNARIIITSGNLAYPGLSDPVPVGNQFTITGGTSSGRSYLTNTASAITSGSVYHAFLLQCTTLPTSEKSLAALLTTNSSIGGSTDPLGVYTKPSGAGYALGLRKNGLSTTFASTPTELSANTTHLVVLKYTFNTGSGSDDTGSLYINPTPGGTEPVTPEVNLTGGTDAAGLQFCGWINQSGGNGTWIFDTLRVGSTWAEVTPSDGPPAPAPTPVITQALFSPQGMILRGTNGPPSSVYQVIASTNVTMPVSNWLSIAAHLFDSSGNFDSTNPVSSGLNQQFFRLLVGGTIPPPLTAPSITNQPQSLIVVVGATANFLVGATGTLPLDYFWSFNTNTPVGGNSSTLSLINVQTNDAGSYRVVVTNTIGSATSSVATLTVLFPPAITDNPTNLTVAAGNSAMFSAAATGSAPLHYQWYFNTNSPLANATNTTLTLNSVNATNTGTYSVVVTNAVGAATSSVAVLTVLGPPIITAQPQSQTVVVSNNATFTVTAAGTAPLAYQWFFNTNTPVGGNSNLFTLVNAQTNDAGTYSVIVTNNYGAVTSAMATLTINPPITNNAIFNLVGFGEAVTGGGIIPETDPAYRKVTTPLEFATAVRDANKTAGSVKVIEIMNNLDLGWNEIDPAVKALTSTPFSMPVAPKLHPVLLVSGVSTVQISPKAGLTIFSANGATIRRASWSLKDTENVIIRNLKFDELWEWDEESKGDYDKNNWDFIVIGVGGGTVSQLWVDHCTFTKAYDGTIDTKGGADHITYSWNKYEGDDGGTNPNSFVWQQINALEANPTAYPMYNFLRTHGFSPTDIVNILQGSGKTHAIGELSLDPVNVNSCVTFHHQWYINPWDRLPRLAGGTVHNYNIYVDAPLMLAARRLRDAKVAAMSPADQTTFANNYNFRPSGNGSISTENGAMLVEKSVYIDCVWPLRNNQTDTNNPVYTGKILGLDTIYSFLETNGSTTFVRGDSTDPGNPLGPFQAPIIPFSWNTNSGTPTGQLPYTYTMDDPSQLQSIVTSATSGAGAGVLNWNKTNWLRTSY